MIPPKEKSPTLRGGAGISGQQLNFTKSLLSSQEKLLQHAQQYTAAVCAYAPTPVNQLIAAILAAQVSAPLPQSWVRIYAVIDAIKHHEIWQQRSLSS